MFKTLLNAKYKISIFAVTIVILGCGNQTNDSSSSGTSGTPVNPTATGNWQIALTATSGAEPFPSLSGYIKDDESDTAAPSPFTTAEMTSTASSGCFIGRNSIFLFGNIAGAQLPLHSSSTNGQVLSVNATLDSSSSTMTGTYAIAGGCADGAAGSVSGFRINTISGTYSGEIDGPTVSQTLQLVVQQNAYGNGNGYFELTGNAVITGISCFGTGTLVPYTSLITGNAIQLTASTTDPSGAQLLIQGSVDAAADAISISNIQVTSGACAGSYGVATLNLQGE
jgi:hypothetical protein